MIEKISRFSRFVCRSFAFIKIQMATGNKTFFRVIKAQDDDFVKRNYWCNSEGPFDVRYHVIITKNIILVDAFMVDVWFLTKLQTLKIMDV